MIPTERNIKKGQLLHISTYFLHKDLIYLIPTIMLDLKPFNGDVLHIRIYLFNLVIQVEIIGKTKPSSKEF
jgi:hypothetical protein